MEDPALRRLAAALLRRVTSRLPGEELDHPRAAADLRPGVEDNHWVGF
jgi:hypothetical protein